MAQSFLNNEAIAKIEKAMQLFSKNYVVVGVTQEHSSRDDDAPINNAEIGYVNHMGSGKIPPRPWLIPVVQENKEKITAYFQAALKKAVEDPDSAKELNEQALNKVGLFIQGKVKRRIRDKIPPPLAARTVAERKAKRLKNKKVQEANAEDFTPLIDTGDFLKSITYDIREA